MKKIWIKIQKVFQTVIAKISNFTIGSMMILGTLFGVKRTEAKKYDTNQIITAGWTFLFGIPVILLFFPNFPMTIWALIIAACLILVNLDEGLMLFYLFSEYGVRIVIHSGDYSQWIQDLYSQPISSLEPLSHST